MKYRFFMVVLLCSTALLSWYWQQELCMLQSEKEVIERRFRSQNSRLKRQVSRLIQLCTYRTKRTEKHEIEWKKARTSEAWKIGFSEPGTEYTLAQQKEALLRFLPNGLPAEYIPYFEEHTAVIDNMPLTHTNYIYRLQNVILGHYAEKYAQKAPFYIHEPMTEVLKDSIVLGDTYTATILVRPPIKYSDFCTVYIRDKEVPVQNNRIYFSERPGSKGVHSYPVRIDFLNPITGKISKYEKTLKYEVY